MGKSHKHPAKHDERVFLNDVYRIATKFTTVLDVDTEQSVS